MRILSIHSPKTKQMKASIEEVIAMASKGQSLEGVLIEGLQDRQVKAMDALMLSRHGIVIPEENIYYDDNDIAYDEDFDDVTWSSEPIQLSFEEKVALANQALQRHDVAVISLNIAVADAEVKQWININRQKVERILSDLLVDLYKTQKVLKE